MFGGSKMNFQDIILEIEKAGRNPNDFNITIFEGGYKVEPKASLEPRIIAREEDAPIKSELEITQEAIDFILMGGM
jgi:hypothetical protein